MEPLQNARSAINHGPGPPLVVVRNLNQTPNGRHLLGMLLRTEGRVVANPPSSAHFTPGPGLASPERALLGGRFLVR